VRPSWRAEKSGRWRSSDIDEYIAGYEKGGLTNVTGKTIADCGHFAPEEQPQAVWQLISAFLPAH
jgi:pimeloyl-ACP methyl ester carboxylesterase